MADTPIVVPTPINPIQIKGAIAFSAEHSRIWAEGTDEEVEKLGGEHSAKGWAGSAGEEAKQYTDEQIAQARVEITDQINTNSINVLNQARSYTDNAVSSEASLRQQADNNLQTQIDAITAASDVFDVVGTYQDLLEYDTSTVPVNDIIKVLMDSTHNDAASYYRWDGTQWVYIGSEGASYTKAEADAKFLSQTEAAATYETQAQSAADIAAAVSTKASSADGSTIVDNGTTISTVAVKEQNDNKAIKKWVGTKAQYEAIATKDANTTYIVTDEDDSAFLTVDSALSATSENPVQNKAIYAALQNVDALPSQTGNSGKYLTTDGTNASWAAVSGGLSNTATAANSLTINGTANTSSATSVNIGDNSQAGGGQSVAIGAGSTTSNSARSGGSGISIGFAARGNYEWDICIGREAEATSTRCICIGTEASATANKGIAVGHGAKSQAQSAIQLGSGTNSTANTFKVFNTTVLNASGKIPAANLDTAIPDVSTKADTDLSNVTKPYVTETYVNGTSWYRVWSDGWCEQGGSIAAATDGTVSLLKPFVDTTYKVFISTTSQNTNFTNNPAVDTKTNSNFTWGTYQGSNSHDWMACGYIS